MVDATLRASFAERIAVVRSKIAQAAHRSGRSPQSVRLVGVSKFHPLEELVVAVDCGVDILGESRVQEAQVKREEWPEGKKVCWHLIGHLQTNKARRALELFDVIQSVDRSELAQAMERILAERGLSDYPILLEVNISGEISKQGVSPNEAEALLEGILTHCPRLRVDGLMTIAALREDARVFFVRLRELAERLRRHSGLPLPELSMGMSGDFESAIEEGSTLVRVGTALFGARPIL